MRRWLPDVRLMPVALIAIGALFALKTVGLILDGGYTLGERLGGDGTLVVTTVPNSQVTQLRSPAVPLEVAPGQPQPKKLSWMQEMFNYPNDITGAIKTTKPYEKREMEKTEAAAPSRTAAIDPPESKATGGTVVPVDQPHGVSAGERALLERLQARRQELDARARELDLRESILKAAEKRAQSQGAAEKTEEAKGGPAAQRKEDADGARIKKIASLYEIMKPKDAAKIFDRLDIKVLIEVATLIKPQRMSEILAQMSPEAAERLTVELAAQSGADRTLNPANLPKIDGRPSGG
jgi:flagellar motility protein MotE (MotC chaperone)